MNNMSDETNTHAVDSGLLPIPQALYACKYCYEDCSWPPDDLHWSAKVEWWLCSNCWDEEYHGEHGIRLDKEITRQNAIGEAREDNAAPPRNQTL